MNRQPAGGGPFRLGGATINQKDVALNVNDFIMTGSLPDKYVPTSSAGGWKDISHGVLKDNKVTRMLNNNVDDRVILSIIDPATMKPIPNTVFKLPDGKNYRSNKEGNIIIIDTAKIALEKEIEAHRKQRVDSIISDLEGIPNDNTAAYMFGLTIKEWTDKCAAGTDALKHPETEKVWMSKDMNSINCSLEMMKTYTPGSKEHNQATAKLRRLVELYEPNYQGDDLSSIDDFTKNIKDGHNIPIDALPGNIHEVITAGKPPAS
jgi:hypothetical protein